VAAKDVRVPPDPPPDSLAAPAAPAPSDQARATPGTPPRRTAFATALLLVGVVLVGLNLRAAVTSLGALLAEVSDGVGLSGTLAGVVTMLPTLSFAGFGLATPWLARRFAPPRILVSAMVLLAAGLATRALTGSAVVFLLATALALSGVAVSNVLLPALVRQYFPDRIGLVTGVYTMTLISGTSAASAASVPIAQLGGSWRVGLGAWALFAVVAIVPWLPAALRRADRPPPRSRTALEARVRPARTGLGWAMAVFFGMQSLNGYAVMGWIAQLFRDAGFTPTTAGVMLASVTGIGIPLALLVPTLAARALDLRPFVLGLSGLTMVSYAGLAVAPSGSPAVLWVLLMAAGQAVFPLALTMIGLRARTPAGTVALSAFTQCAGYLVAGLGPLLVGVFYEATGGWTVPLGFLIVTVLVQTWAGLRIARPRYIEDE
jgi:CP family cyanate transporter-like MFS transporter